MRIVIDNSVTPVVQHVRRIPIALRQQVEDQLHKLLRLGIIEEVKEHSPWVSPMVVVIKDNGDVRLCIDMRRANTAIKREYHMIPTLDDLLARCVFLIHSQDQKQTMCFLNQAERIKLVLAT